jgi:2-oxoglutarate dehydrogenase complex dehydrogenase (E1) component-like enzyme
MSLICLHGKLCTSYPLLMEGACVLPLEQVGFTTMPRHGRSSPHPSDVLKVIGAPILHANADDPEAVVQAMIMAADWRTRYVYV